MRKDSQCANVAASKSALTIGYVFTNVLDASEDGVRTYAEGRRKRTPPSSSSPSSSSRNSARAASRAIVPPPCARSRLWSRSSFSRAYGTATSVSTDNARSVRVSARVFFTPVTPSTASRSPPLPRTRDPRHLVL
eukprot:31293-Pelagococcus_subviridis.AAC.12